MALSFPIKHTTMCLTYFDEFGKIYASTRFDVINDPTKSLRSYYQDFLQRRKLPGLLCEEWPHPTLLAFVGPERFEQELFIPGPEQMPILLKPREAKVVLVTMMSFQKEMSLTSTRVGSKMETYLKEVSDVIKLLQKMVGTKTDVVS